jgi:hypothetical protein
MTEKKVLTREEKLKNTVKAQKEKIVALTQYSKELREKVINSKYQLENDCKDIINSYDAKIDSINSNYKYVLVISIMFSLLIGFSLRTFLF